MKNYIKEIRQEYDLRKENIDRQYAISMNVMQYCKSEEEIFDLLSRLYVKYDYNFFLNELSCENIIKSIFYKFCRFIIVQKNKKSKLLITPSVIFELIYQVKILNNDNLFNFIKDNYLSLIDDNIFFYDEDILNFIEIEIFSKENGFKSYLQLNNSLYKNKGYLNQSIENYYSEIKDNFFLISYYLLLCKNISFQDIFGIDKIDIAQQSQIINNIQQSKENHYINSIISTDLFFISWNLPPHSA